MKRNTLLFISIFFTTLIGLSACGRANPTQINDLNSRVLSLWGNKHDHCAIQPQSILGLRAQAIKEGLLQDLNLEEAQTHALAQNYEHKGQLQEAIWLYSETGNPEDLKKAQSLKIRLFEILTHGHYTVNDRNLGGSSPKKFLIFDGGIEAIFKDGGMDPNYPWANANAEVAAYVIDDEFLHVHLVPMTVSRTLNGVSGSVQVFLKNSTVDVPQSILVRNFSLLAYFDHFLGNSDRKLSNILFLPLLKRVVAIDNGASFASFQCHDSSVAFQYLSENPSLSKQVLNINLHHLKTHLAKLNLLDISQLKRFESIIKNAKKAIKSSFCQLRYPSRGHPSEKTHRLEVFGEGAFCYVAPDQEGTMTVSYPSRPEGSISIFLSNQDFKYPKSQNRIYLNHSPQNLPVGKIYNYILTARGEWRFADITNSIEYGTSALDLAQGNAVLVAGELEIHLDGHYQFNMNNQSLTQRIFNLHPNYTHLLESRTRQLFQNELGGHGEFVQKGLAKQIYLTHEELANLCRSEVFRVHNTPICDQS